jgi:hypothetical protein
MKLNRTRQMPVTSNPNRNRPFYIRNYQRAFCSEAENVERMCAMLIENNLGAGRHFPVVVTMTAPPETEPIIVDYLADSEQRGAYRLADPFSPLSPSRPFVPGHAPSILGRAAIRLAEASAIHGLNSSSSAPSNLGRGSP